VIEVEEEVLAGPLDVLERLQELDTRIQNLENLKLELPRRIAQLKAVVDSEEIDLERAKASVMTLEQAKLAAERDTEECRKQAAHAEEKLASITNNTEYQAAVKEIGNLKKRLTELEAAQGGFAEKIHASQTRLENVQKSYEGHKSEYDGQHSDVNGKLSEINSQLEKHLAMRKTIVGDLTPPLLSKYDRLRKSSGGLAVSVVVNGVCQACHFSLTSQRLNLMRRGTEIFQCDHCQRLLILK
jgi:predicted  nucleic acid-binding Zn-ribbon protein